ncbi:Surfeit locus protein 1 [Acorus calamus]|uniref:SURF1-like protein n=1 Tax=Acorus calamus TaxID=4465 RepID=A0AAV9FFN3_ACOCL|nr:Surfeit locus protein 1 [Acorus calamus]
MYQDEKEDIYGEDEMLEENKIDNNEADEIDDDDEFYIRVKQASMAVMAFVTELKNIISQGCIERPLAPISRSEYTYIHNELTGVDSEELQNGRGRLSRWLLFLPGAITFGLGTWQIFRRQEKIEMLEYRRKRLETEPILWNKITSSDVDLDSLEFKKVMCEGFFDESKSIYVGPRSRSISGVTENGYYIVTPLILVTNHPESVQMAVLVNRGWVPRKWRDESFHLHDGEKSSSITPPHIEEVEEWNPWWKFWSKKSKSIKPEEPPSTPIKVVGVVRGNEKPSIFVPANDPSSGQWFYVDISAMARACGLPENTIYVEDINDSASASNPYPVPKDVNTLIRFSVMPQDHLNYTMTWYVNSA